MRCYTPGGVYHGTECCGYVTRPRDGKGGPCTRPAKYHVNYLTGCAHFCGIHMQRLRRRRPGSEVTPLEAK